MCTAGTSNGRELYMNEGAVGYIIAIGFCYLILTAAIPALFLYNRIKHRPFLVRFAAYQVTGNLWITAWGFLFSYLNIWSEWLVILVALVLPVAVKLFVFRRDLFERWRAYEDDKKEKLVTSRGTVRAVRRKLQQQFCAFFERYIRHHYIVIIILILLAVFAVWYYGYFKIHYFTYASSDEATHLYWINSLFAGDSFPVGMYPHSMHFTMAAIHSISGIQTLIVNHYFSVIIMLMVHFTLFLAIKELVHSTAAAIGAVGIYLFTDMFIAARYHNTLPMEFGLIAMFAMLIFLTEFIRKRDRFSMWMAALAAGWTFHAHFYVGIFCLFLGAAYIIVYLKTMIRLKLLLKMLLILVVSAVVVVVPFAIGYAVGHRFEQSVDWALGVMGVDADKDISPDFIYKKTDDPESLKEDRNDRKDDKEDIAEQEERELTSIQKEFMTASGFEEFTEAAEHLLTERLLAFKGDAPIIYNLLAFAFIYGIAVLIWSGHVFRKKFRNDTGSKKTYRQAKQAYLVRNGLLLFVPAMVTAGIICGTMSYLGMIEVIDDTRASLMLAPVAAFLFALPIKAIEDLLGLIPVKNRSVIGTATLLCVGGGLGVFFTKAPVKLFVDLRCYAVTQQLSNELTKDLIANHERNTWTVISPVNDLLAIRNYGYHYEIVDLLMEIEDGDSPIFMPTQDLYVVVEKESMNMNGYYWPADYHTQIVYNSDELREDSIDQNYYDLGYPWESPEMAYTDYRNVTMSKFYYWMEAFKKAFPHEVEVYSEDETVVVYHIRQDEDFPLNLAVDYRRNNYGVDALDDYSERYFINFGVPYEPE